MVKQRTLFSLEQLKFQALTRRIKYRTIKITTDFKNKLKETKKLAYLYGNLSFNTIERTAKRATTLSGKQMHNFAIILESRLDVILYRIRFFKTISTAREWISNGWVVVNGNPVTVHSYELRAGDVISIIPEKHYLLHQEIISDITKKFSYSSFLTSKKDRYLNNRSSFTGLDSLRFYLTKSFLRKGSHLFWRNQRINHLADKSSIYHGKSEIWPARGSLNGISYLYKTALTVRRILNKTYLLKNQINNQNRSLFRIRYYKRQTNLSASRALIRASMLWHLYKKYLLNAVFSAKKGPLLLNKKQSIYFSPSKNINRRRKGVYFQTGKGASYFKKRTIKTVWKNLGLRLKQKTSRKGYSWLCNKNQNRLIGNIKSFQSYRKIKSSPFRKNSKFGRKNFFYNKNNHIIINKYDTKKGTGKKNKGKESFYNTKYNIKKRYRFGGQKPIHMEVSYKTLTAVYLYSPQLLFYPALIDFDYILRRVWRK